MEAGVEFDAKTIRHLEAKGLLRRGWREKLASRERRDRAVRAYYQQLKLAGVKSTAAILDCAETMRISIKLVERIVYGGDSGHPDG